MADTASAGIVGKGVTMSYATDTAGTAGSYTVFSEVVGTVQFPELGCGDVEFTNTLSAGSAAEKKPDGWIDVSDMDMMLNYIHGTEAALVALVAVPSFFKITLPNTHTWIFRGYIKKLGGEIPNKGAVTRKVTFAISGLPAYA